jgi:adenylosuccinate synthase
MGAKCMVGNGVVVHIKSLIEELRMLTEAGVDYSGRLFLSDRAHIVFDFHQEIDRLNEKDLGKSKLGTTCKGIGPAYGSKVMRNGLRVGDLQDMEWFETRLRKLAEQEMKAYPGLTVDIESELTYYKSVRDEILSLTVDTVTLANEALADGKKILIEGANATSK